MAGVEEERPVHWPDASWVIARQLAEAAHIPSALAREEEEMCGVTYAA